MLRKCRRGSPAFGCPCKCLVQAFYRAQRGDNRPYTITCTSDKCPIREIEIGIVDDFLELVGALPDDLASLPHESRSSECVPAIISRGVV